MGLKDEEVELLLWIDEQSKAWVMGRGGGQPSLPQNISDRLCHSLSAPCTVVFLLHESKIKLATSRYFQFCT